jgi:NAD(P)-dependent dehydrogenase (short-subunit alcohol dehydrogenase family)
MNDKIAIVTGGRRGIGGGISVALSKVGYNLLIVDVERDEAAEATMAAARANGAEVAFFKGDVSAIDTHGAVIEAARALPGRLRCLVNNAGVTSLVRGDMLELTPESYDRVMRINLRGAFFLSQAFSKALIAEAERTPAGDFRCIINITSANAEILGVERADYTVSKAALSMVTRLYALRLAPHLINVYEIRPGMIKTDMTAVVADKYEKVLADGGVPFGRWGYPEDIGQTAAMLAAGHLPFTTGEFIWVDGGIGLRRP